MHSLCSFVPCTCLAHPDRASTMADLLNSAITPLRPHLLPLITSLPEPVHDFLDSLLGPHCHTTLVRALDVTPDCLSLAISKALGIAIIGASSIVKIPQLLKILASRSAAGLSLLSVLLETAAYLITLAYNFRNGNPFSTYGETALITAQNIAICLAILSYTGRPAAAAALVAALAVATSALFASPALGGAPELIDTPTLAILQAGAGALGIAAKVPQIVAVAQQGGTGQLSAFAVFNYLFGSLARIFTTLKEVDDVLILGGFVAGFALNLVLAGQMVWYWNAKETDAQGRSGAQKVEVAAGEGARRAEKSSGSVRKGTTRRRG